MSARAPLDTAVDPALYSILDANGFPNDKYPLYHTAGVKDGPLTQACGPSAVPGFACGDYGVNTMQPSNAPTGSGTKLPLISDKDYPNIGDLLSAAKISWNWYSGGWDDAAAGNPGKLFQFHHQPLNYWADYGPTGSGRVHLKDEDHDFLPAVQNGTLPTVSFVKPYGSENEHPGYASEPNGSDNLVNTINAILAGPQARDTLIVVTYDEFGGQWDHVPPPGQAGSPGVHDEWGPGTRIPAVLISKSFKRSGVDHTSYDTTSILATIEHSLGLAALSPRDAQVADLGAAVDIGMKRGS